MTYAVTVDIGRLGDLQLYSSTDNWGPGCSLVPLYYLCWHTEWTLQNPLPTSPFMTRLRLWSGDDFWRVFAASPCPKTAQREKGNFL